MTLLVVLYNDTQELLQYDTLCPGSLILRATCLCLSYCCVRVNSVIAMLLNRTAWDQRKAHFLKKYQKKTGMSGSDINVLEQGTVEDLANG